MTGKNNFFFKVFGLLMNCDNMVGKDFEKGLASLKAVAEAAPDSHANAAMLLKSSFSDR